MFGQLRVRVDDATLTSQDFGGAKPRTVFAQLVLARGHPVTKEALADRLWPDAAPKNVAGTLETYISQLRKTLFSDRATARRVLATSTGAYRLTNDELTLDIDVFDDLVARADISDNDRVLLRCQAANLASGDLLEDFGNPPWLQAERELYRDRVTRVHVLLGEDKLAMAAFTEALKHAEDALQLRPYAEEAHRILMLANHALGHGEAARLAFIRCRSVLADELSHDPTTETEDLAAAIDAGVPAQELIVGRQAAPLAPAPVIAPPSSDRRDPSRRLPFFGRDAEVAAVEAQVHMSRAGSFRLVLVTGAVGMGRTALVDHLYRNLPGVVGREQFKIRHRDLPALPLARSITHALRRGAGALGAAEYANAPLLTGGAETFDALARVLRANSPMVLLLDDVQWADANAIAALGWLRRRHPDLPLTIVATTRTGATIRAHHLETLDAHQTIPLDPLQPDGSLERAGIGSELVEITGGIPRLLADHWRWLQAGGSGPSPSLRSSVLRAVRGLGGAYPAILQAASHLDEPFDLFALELVSAQDEATLAALDELCRIGFLDRNGPCYRFRSPLVRQIIANTVGPRVVGADRSVSS